MIVRYLNNNIIQLQNIRVYIQLIIEIDSGLNKRVNERVYEYYIDINMDLLLI